VSRLGLLSARVISALVILLAFALPQMIDGEVVSHQTTDIAAASADFSNNGSADTGSK